MAKGQTNAVYLDRRATRLYDFDNAMIINLQANPDVENGFYLRYGNYSHSLQKSNNSFQGIVPIDPVGAASIKIRIRPNEDDDAYIVLTIPDLDTLTPSFSSAVIENFVASSVSYTVKDYQYTVYNGNNEILQQETITVGGGEPDLVSLMAVAPMGVTA